MTETETALQPVDRILVCGGRDYADKETIKRVLNELYNASKFTQMIEGGASGADSLCASWAGAIGIHVIEVKAQWDKYGKRAGPIRNADMLNLKPDLVVAFPGGRGTKDMIGKAKAAGVKVIEVPDSTRPQ